jgi:IrrE N-terminal-like domain
MAVCQAIVKIHRRKTLAAIPNGGRREIRPIDNPKGYYTAAERRTLLARLFARAKQERGSTEFIELLRFVSRFHGYSVYNRALIFHQCPQASFVAGREQWRTRHGRTVTPGQPGIGILVPFGHGASFQLREVFDISQTEGRPLPERVANPFPVSGPFQTRWLDRLLDWARALGIEVVWESRSALEAGHVMVDRLTLVAGSATASAASGFLPLAAAILGRHGHGAVRQSIPDQATITIVLNSAGDLRRQFATLVHELAHVLLGHLGEDSRRQIPDRHALPRHVRELEAEAVAFVVTAEFGLDIYAEKYLAGYRPEDAPLVGENHVVFAAGTLVRVIKGGYRQPNTVPVAADQQATNADGP